MRTPALIALLSTSAAAAAQPLYTVTDLGRHPDYTFSTVALSLNNHGQVCGCVQASLTRAFVWTAASGIQLLPPVPGNENRGSVAVDINDLGEIVGYSGAAGGSNIVAWVYRNGSYTLLGSLPGYGSVTPAAINNLTQVVGSSTPGNTTAPSEDFFWSPQTGIRDFVAGKVVEPYDINDAGIVTGGIRGQDPAAGVMTWDLGGEAVDLGSLPGGDLNFGYSINEQGQVAGVSIEILTPSGARLSHGVVSSMFGVQDLGQYQSVASGINESGAVVGWRTNGTNSSWYSWLYRPGMGVITDLRTVIDDPALYTRISEARGINDRGQIIATTTLSSGTSPSRRAVILTPIGPACGTADFNSDGDSGTDQDIEAFFACVGGACCPTCYPGGADFNADGDSGTDQDIEAFFRVLGGNPC